MADRRPVAYHAIMPPLVMDLLYIPAFLIALPVLLYQRIVLKKRRGGWGQRFGFLPRRSSDKPAIWIHAVSLGEVNATRTLVDEIGKRLPDHDVVISATTNTGYAAACQQYGPQRVFRYPLDFSFVVKRALNRIRPAAIVLMELEVWPNLLTLASRRGIAVGIANGRVTEEKSMRRFRKPLIRTLARRMFSQVAWIGAQDAAYAARFAELGAPADQVSVTGSLKYDTAVVTNRVSGDCELAAAMGIDTSRPLIVAGSTGPGEEEMLLEAYARLRKSCGGGQLAIIPRKPERFDEVARLIESRGLSCVRRSRRPDGAKLTTTAPEPDAVFLGDTMGELRKFYSLAAAVFVGRTLVKMGGSDVMEVAALAKPMCFGPHIENFADAVEKLTAAGAAIQIDSTEELCDALQGLVEKREESTAMGRRAQEVVRQNMGATARTVDLLVQSLRR